MTVPNPDQKTKRDAERKAAALHNLGPERGTGGLIWAYAAHDQLSTHESARDEWRNNANIEVMAWVYSTAFLVVVAAHQVAVFARRVNKLTGDHEMCEAIREFESHVPDAEALRDVVTHMDEYAIGEGRRQIGKQGPPMSDKSPSPFIYWEADTKDASFFSLGDEQVNLGCLARAAWDLGQVTESVRAKHLKLAEDDAQAATHRLRSGN